MRRVGVKTLVTRVGQTQPVRRQAGLMIDSDTLFTDLLLRTLSFGASPISEDRQVDILASLSAGGVELLLSNEELMCYCAEGGRGAR